MAKPVLNQDQCTPEPGNLIAFVNPGRCEAKGPCVLACPYNVLVLKPLTQHQKKEFSFLGRFKARVHGNKRAVLDNPDDCHACGLCVQACPEKAITLIPRDPSSK